MALLIAQRTATLKRAFFFFLHFCQGSPSNQPPDNPTCLITIGAQLLPDMALSVSDTLTAALDQFLPAVSVIPWEKCCPNRLSIYLFVLNLAFSNKSQQSSLVTETKEKDHC